jgi:hypothetical protein
MIYASPSDKFSQQLNLIPPPAGTGNAPTPKTLPPTSTSQPTPTPSATTSNELYTSNIPTLPFDATIYNNMLRDLINYYDSQYTDPEEVPMGGQIPVVINLELDGIAGIKIGNIFDIKGNIDPKSLNYEILPLSYRGESLFNNKDSKIGLKMKFLVKSLSQAVQDASWITRIEGYPFVPNGKRKTSTPDFQTALKNAYINGSPWIITVNNGRISVVNVEGITPQYIFDTYDKAEQAEPGFKAKVKQVASQLGVDELALVKIMYKESQINPQARNADTKATGLIQFIPDTAIGLGTTVDALYKMKRIEQMDYVRKYFDNYNVTGKTYAELYLITFYPFALTKSNDYIIGSEVSAPRAIIIAEQNKGIKKYSTQQLNGQPVITRADFLNYANALL